MGRQRITTIAAVAGALLASALLSACGTDKIQVAQSDPLHSGAVLFQQRCSGCHSLTSAGANGSAANVRKSMRTNGPNFNVRKESYQRVIYAIQNGGFSGAIMPGNIVTGADAKLVATFLAKYSGVDAHTPPSPNPMPAVAAGAAKSAAPKTDLVALGRQVYAQNGCGACHMLKDANSVGKVGPTLQGVGADPAAMIKTSIINPNAVVVKPYPAGVMPQTFGKILTAQQIDALVAYLQSVAR